MEGRGRKRTFEMPTANPNKQTATEALMKYTIPRKKRVFGQVLLEPCPEESRDYTLIQSKLKEARLDMRMEHANDWQWKDVKLVHNEAFLKEFSEKRSDMHAKGRHGREMEECYCFLVESYEATTQIYQYGLRTGSQDQCFLGKSSHGVYLFKHIDVALKHGTANNLSGKNLIVFKVLFGKVKKVTPSMEWNKTVDPMVTFDCHMANDAVSYQDNLSQQVLGSSVYLFDYNENQELNQRPRQCIPYAVVSFASAMSLPVSPSKLPESLKHEPLEHSEGYTLAKKRGNGENPTVILKRFATPGCPGQEYQPQASRVDATPFQHNVLQNPSHLISEHLYKPLFPTAEHFEPSMPYCGSGNPWKNYGYEAALSNVQKLTTTSSCENNTGILDITPQSSAEKNSTIVYSSRIIKDPRLFRPETSIEKKSSDEEKTSNVSVSDEQECQIQSHNQGLKTDFSVSCEKQSMQMEAGQKENNSTPSSDKSHESDPEVEEKTEIMPSFKLFKMKFQKYAAYLTMTEEERCKNIWSLEKLTSEQKQTLIDRIHSYKMYDQGNKQRLDCQKNNICSFPHEESSNHEMCLSPGKSSPLLISRNHCQVVQFNTEHLVNSDVSNLTSTNDLEDSKRNKVDALNADSDKIRQNSTDSKENIVQEIEPSTDFQVEHYVKAQDGGTSQATGDLRDSEQSLQEVCLQTDPLEINKASETTGDSGSTLSTTIEVYPEFQEHNIGAMDVANCVDVSEVTESNDCSTDSAVGQDLNGPSSTDNQNIDSLAYYKSESSSEMAVEVKRGETQHSTFYYALYKRLQLDQLLPNSNGVNLFSGKSYLRPKGMDTVKDNHLKETEDLQLIVKIQSSQTPATAERPTLSDRFSKLRGHNDRLTSFIHMKNLANKYTAHLSGDVKCDSVALISSNGEGTSPENNNAKLVQLMAQRYRADRLLTNGKRLRRKRSKILGRNKSNSGVLCKISSGQLLIQVLRRAVNTRNRYLLKEKKKCQTNQASKKSSCGQASFSKGNSESSNFLSSTETTDHFDKEHEPQPNSSERSQSEIQSQNKCVNSEDANASPILTIDTPIQNPPDCENKTSNDDGLGHVCQSEEKCIGFAKQSTDIVCDNISNSSNHSNVKKSRRNKKLTEMSEQVHLNKIEAEKERNNTGHQQNPSPVSCSHNSESNSDDKNAKEEHKEDNPLPRLRSQVMSKKARQANCNIKKIITDHTTVNKDRVNHDQHVLNTSSDKASGKAIAKAQRAVTPDLPKFMKNKTDTNTKTMILVNSAGNNSASDDSKSVVDIKVSALDTVKSKETEAHDSIQKHELHSDAKSTDANDKDSFSKEEGSNTDQISLKTVKCNKKDSAKLSTENMNHFSKPTSVSESQPAVEGTQCSWTVTSQVETTENLHSKFIKDAKADDLAARKDIVHSAWQGQNRNSTPNTSETHIISKLRDYVTKFEFTVKKQESENESGESQIPMAWITLDSTGHKSLLHIRHYNKQALADPKHQNPAIYPIAPIKHKQCDEHSQLTNEATKRQKRSNHEAVSQDFILTDTLKKQSDAKLLSHKDHQPLHKSSNALNIKYSLQNPENILQQNHIVPPEVSGNTNMSSGEQVNQSVFEKTNKGNEQTLYNEKEHKTEYSVPDISSTLKLADHAISLAELRPLQSKCKTMLEHFISVFEKDQNIYLESSCISRKHILEKYLDHPPPPVELKFEAINSFLELQMMMEACHFVENKINFLRKKPRFRSLLWYDPSLYGELYKGSVGFQQQSSLFSSFQQCLASEDYSKLQEYYGAVSTLHQQLQDAPDTSYYMYLKTKRERLEIEAALRNPTDVKSFFLSVPVAAAMNFGDTLENLETVQNKVMRFIETPADQLPGIFDVGKAEHLSIICRYLHEKALFLKSHKERSKVSWFGLEHLLYDASKVLVWNESMHGKSNDVLKNYKQSNPQIVYGVTETGFALVKNMKQPPQAKETIQITQPQQMNAVRHPKPGLSIESAQTARNIENGIKETNQPANKSATCPPPRLNFIDLGVTPFIPPSLSVPLGNPSPYNDFSQSSNSGSWQMPRTHIWDWTPHHSSTSNSEIRPLYLSKRRMTTPHMEPRATSITDHQNSHAVRQQLLPPHIVKPRPVGRINHQSTIRAPHHAELLKEQSRPIIKPLPIQSFPIDTTVKPPALSPLAFSNTPNTIPLHNNPTPISYPYFLLNGQTYPNVAPSVPVPALHNETQYHPHPV